MYFEREREREEIYYVTRTENKLANYMDKEQIGIVEERKGKGRK